MGALILAGGGVNGHISGNHFVNTQKASTVFISFNSITPSLGIYPKETPGHWEKFYAQRYASISNSEKLVTAAINHGRYCPST